MKIIIIGAGPIGCYCGYLLAKQGHSVDIYEEHKEIGLPIQCTGLLTTDFDQFNFPKESFLINTFEEIEVFSPGGKKAVIKQKEYLVDRHKFDQYLAELAKEAGAKIHLQHSFLRKEEKNLIIKNNITHKEFSVIPDIIIGADGPLSKIAKAYGFYQESRVNYQGVQALVGGKFNPRVYQTFFGRNVCPDLFGWIVPESETRARMGLASTSKDARKMFEQFMSNYDYAVIEMQAGMIPLYHPKQKLKQDNCYLLGDASSFVKATTLGGLIPGLKQAEVLAECISNNQNYEREVKVLRRRMNLHLRLRNIFNKFSDKDWDILIEILGSKKMKKLLSQHTRDSPGPLVFKALLIEPRLWRFGKFLF